MDLLIPILVVALVGGIAMWLIRYLGTPEPLAKLLTVAVVIVLVIYFLNAIGFRIPNVLH